MPNIRDMTVVASTAVLTVGTDPNNSKTLLILKDAILFAPVAVQVDLLTTLEMTSSFGDHRIFVGQVDGNLYQVETIGFGVLMTAKISS